MSTDYESVISPPMGPDNLAHSLSMASNPVRSEGGGGGGGGGGGPHSGISYEGRVSLISPMSRYDQSVRAALAALDHPTSQINSGSSLHSPPLYSSQCLSRLQQSFYNSSYLEGSLRSMMPIQLQSHSTPGSSKGSGAYYPFQGEKSMGIKQENCDLGFESFENPQPMSDSRDLNVEYEGHSSRLESLSELRKERETPESKISDKEVGNFDSLPKSNFLKQDLPNADSDSRISLSEKLVPVDSPAEYESHFISLDGEERTFTPEIESQDQREMDSEASHFLSNYLDTTQEVINHGENAKSLKCQYCPYSTDSKQEFNLHSSIHFDHKCMKCEFTTQTVDQLKDHLKDEHDLSSEEVIDFESARVPRINSQGKVKTFKCKQCGFVAITKSDFWEHTKSHIKSEKLLACNKCPFVTEYKHHLEYHMRNHFGTKPFKCNKCSYSCVNKSMLNSHMKSHSNIYQYRCSDCTYATKYCHSLKLHLRKYGHTPAMVLNPDGTPNPVPIIDIYGTRRGPKLKKDENGMPILPPQYQLQAQVVRAHMEVTGTIPPAPTVPLDKYTSKSNGNSINLSIPTPQFQNNFQFSGIQSYPSFIPHEFMDKEQIHSRSEAKVYEKESKEEEEKLNVSKSPEVQETLKCEICNFSTETKSILSHHMLLHAKEKEELEKIEKTSLLNNENEVPSQNNSSNTNNDLQRISPPVHKLANENVKQSLKNVASPIPNHQNALHDYFVRAMNPLLYPPLMGGQGFVHSALELQQQLQRLVYQTAKEQGQTNNEKTVNLSPIKIQGQSETVLDLSKDQTPPGSSSSQHTSSSTSSPSFFPASPPNSDVSTPPSKNRRKGRAYKLERIALRLSGSGEEENSCSEGCDKSSKEPDAKRHKIDAPPPLLPISTPELKNDKYGTSINGTNGKWKEIHQCHYCDIAFKDIVMYTMHMGYHGYRNPFTCNMCGYDAEDKLAFFLHIARSSHV